jgi:L-seryl-tRNA(Ser) seleniumtransferase
LPAVDEILRDESLAAAASRLPRRQIAATIRTAIDQFRQVILSGDDHELEKVMPATDAELLRQLVIERTQELLAQEECRGLQKVINATGILLHTNLGRAPLAKSAVKRLKGSVGYTNLEVDLVTGKRSRRGERVTELLAQLTGAEDAVVVNNCAAATMLALQAIAQGREVVVSRGQLVEIGGGFRLPEVFHAAGVSLREVGTTNRTYARDYEEAISEQTGAIIRVHRSNFSLAGFVTEPSIEELVGLRRPPQVAVIDDLGSGLVVDLSRWGIQEPSVLDSIAAGADLCLFSGDKLFGGPQAGIIVGKRKWTERLKTSPLMRAMRTDKLTLAALEATTEIYLADRAFELIPLFRMLSKKPLQIEAACQAVRTQLGPSRAQVTVTPCVSYVGGGSLPGHAIPSFALRIRSASAETLASRLRLGKPAIQGRLAEDCLLLDLRTVPARDLPLLTQRLQAVLSGATACEKEPSGNSDNPPSAESA